MLRPVNALVYLICEYRSLV